MNRLIYIISFFCAITANILNAQDHQEAHDEGMVTGLRRRALVVNINTRVLEIALSTSPHGEISRTQTVVWNETNHKVVIPGSPINIQLGGSNLRLSVQFTPFVRRNDKILVAQGQIWISQPDQGVSYYTSIQTIPFEFDEPIYFFPLGQSAESNSSSSIEIIVTVNPYRIRQEQEENINAENDE